MNKTVKWLFNDVRELILWSKSRGFEIPAVGRRSGLLPPGRVQITTVDRVEAKIV